MTRDEVIAALDLAPHVEGGYFRRTYASPLTFRHATGDTRPLLTSIFYLLTADAPRGRLHRNRSDILHYWHAGGALRYWLIDPDGALSSVELGPDIAHGQQLQLLVPGGWWKATELLAGDFGLLSEAVAPGFDFADMELGDAGRIAAAWPQHWPILQVFCTPWPPALAIEH